MAARQLRAWGLPELVPTTELIVGELLTNAVLHGSAPIRLRLIRHAVLVCEVSDGGVGRPCPRNAGPQNEGGRGLMLIARSCRRFGTRVPRTARPSGPSRHCRRSPEPARGGVRRRHRPYRPRPGGQGSRPPVRPGGRRAGRG